MTSMSADRGHRVAILAGWPSIRDYVRLVRSQTAVNAAGSDRELIAGWREAHTHARRLQPLGHDSQDAAACPPLPTDIAVSAETDMSTPLAEQSFGLLPYECQMVELDQLICWQRYVNLTFARRLQDKLPNGPSAKCVYDFIFGPADHDPPVSVEAGPSANHIVLSSASSDLRVLDTAIIPPSKIDGLRLPGRMATAVVIAVGYSFNCLTAVEYRNRLVMTNGTHHAYALRARGVRHAPCVVRRLSSSADFDLVAQPISATHTLEWHFAHERPPVLKDYFDPNLVRVFESWSRRHVLHIDLKLTKFQVGDAQ